jgi:hypothetical protein
MVDKRPQTCIAMKKASEIVVDLLSIVFILSNLVQFYFVVLCKQFTGEWQKWIQNSSVYLL